MTIQPSFEASAGKAEREPWTRWLWDMCRIFRLPRVSINLMCERTAGNDPFYARVVKKFYEGARRRHPKFPVVRAYEYGFALCKLSGGFEGYLGSLKSSARANCRKAVRLGYSVSRFDFNSSLEDIRGILRSTPVRQGVLPEYIREGRVHPVSNPPSLDRCHDYIYLGVFKSGKLVAYAGCMICGELAEMNEIFGHAEYRRDGVVALLVVELAREIFKSYPQARYFGYGTYFGGSESMRRFKRKFLFEPYHVDWVL